MKRRKAITGFLLLIFLTATSLVFTSLSNTIFQEIGFNRKANRESRRNSINNPVLDSSNNETHETMSIYYRLSTDINYRYEFRFEFNPSTKNDDHRLMLILYGTKRACNDMWDFSVGIRTLTAIRYFGYSILAICSRRKTYDIDIPIGKNNDIKYIYLSLQAWMNAVYYARFKRYPLLYIHATSRGSKFAGILCRILPIQAQILYIFPGHRDAMLTNSAYDSDMQTRLLYDSAYASWFYFDFCYNGTNKNVKNRTLCPFYSDQNYFYPVPPTFFTFLKNDPYQKENVYKYIIGEIFRKSANLGVTLLNKIGTLPLDILHPIQPKVSYMQENFLVWHSKPHAAQWFFEHFTNPEKYRTTDSQRQTCWCSEIDFKYFELMPHITMIWSRKKQDEYSDYVRDIRKFEDAFCEEVCGDLLTTHSMISRNINKTLGWINEMDQLRRSVSDEFFV
jgi:hypothetical protein